MKTKRICIVSYNMRSQSVKNLQQALQKVVDIPVLRIKKDSTKYQPRYTDYILNWGCSQKWPFITHDEKYGNQLAVDKLTFFTAISKYNNIVGDLDKINLPNWTDNYETARSLQYPIMCRTILNGHSGSGIVLANTDKDLVECPLYVEYKKKKNEYRVHVFNGKVIDITQKRTRKDAEFVDTKIRNFKNGWIYARENLEIPHDLELQALRVVGVLGLKFGAVDLIWNEYENKSYVLEVNTAPGVVGTTLTNYVNAILGDLH